MDVNDIERQAGTSYMLVVSNSTDDETRSELDTLIDGYATVDINPNHDPDDARELVEGSVHNSDFLVTVREFDDMTEDMQRFLAQYLKGIAERYVEVPIVVFDSEGNNLEMANPDLCGRLYSL